MNPNWDDRTEHFRVPVTESGVGFTYDPGNDVARMNILTDFEELPPVLNGLGSSDAHKTGGLAMETSSKSRERWKTICGVGSFLVVLALTVFGVFALFAGIGFVGQDAAGEGNIDIVLAWKKIEIMGLSAQTFVFFAGVFMVVTAAIISMKVYDKAHYEVMQDRARGLRADGKKPDSLPWAFIRHFNPVRESF